jgi:phytoene dehydrogenase-like protein
MHLETQLRVSKGYSALVDDFVKQIKHHDGVLISGARVRRVAWKRGKAKITVERGGRQEALEADVAVMPCPLVF